MKWILLAFKIKKIIKLADEVWDVIEKIRKEIKDEDLQKEIDDVKSAWNNLF